MGQRDMQTHWRCIILLILASVFVASALLIFAVGFFPYKPFIPGFAVFSHDEDIGEPPSAPFDKVIFMVVDALRSDFVYSPHSGFSFLQSLIRSGEALPFTANANSPTITMPKIKAITTGSVPSFLDVILNFAESDTSSSLTTQDTWLNQLKRKDGGNLIMFGDDTWLKLFPDTFARSDGTTSFFVSDFTEVDQNVTRHIARELQQKDWNGMIMHYLGLDHIGHKSGPKSYNMRPKQMEMDEIVRTVFAAIKSKSHLESTLLVLCGDHGMNEGGNHGGAGEGETSPALVFLSPKLVTFSHGSPSPLDLPHQGRSKYYEAVEQSDIAPTLAALLGFPVPLNNLGVLIRRTLSFWSEEQQIHLMHQNALQILRIAESTFPQMASMGRPDNVMCEEPLFDALKLSCLWARAVWDHHETSHESKLDAYQDFCRGAQTILSSAASNYDNSKLILGICLATVSMLLSLMTSVFATWPLRPSSIVFWAVTTTLGAMMFASSYIEEEHHFWYWVASSWMMWGFVKYQRRLSSPSLTGFIVLLPLGLLRIMRSWNQTGQKHAGSPDIAKHLMPTNLQLLWLLVLLSYTVSVSRLSRYALPTSSRWIAASASIILGVTSFTFKLTFTIADAPELLAGFENLVPEVVGNVSLVFQARLVFGMAFILALGTIVQVARASPQRKVHSVQLYGIHEILTIVLITQTRAVNIPLFLLFDLQAFILGLVQLSSTEVSVTSLLLQHVAFYGFGGSNAISSIDLSNAYNGISGYNVGAVGMLTFVGNWAGPIWWSSAGHTFLSRRAGFRHSVPFLQGLSYTIVFSSVSTLAVMIACAALRSHLFIWTVFSPKYLYALAWFFGQTICVNIGYGGLLYMLGNSLEH